MRVKRSSHRKNRRKKILNLAEGYWGGKSRLHKLAKDQVQKSLQYAYRDRKQRKRHFRALWITRINAAAR
jgi:large subunit ribosomal protein L20